MSDHLDGPAPKPEDAPPNYLPGAFAARLRLGSNVQSSRIIDVADADQLDPVVIIKLAQQENRYSLVGLLVGAAAFGGGLAMVVFTHSTGSVDLLIQYGSTQIHIVTVVIGVVIALFGMMIIWMTRPNIKLGSTDYGGIALRDARPRGDPRASRDTQGGLLRWRKCLARKGNLAHRQDKSASISGATAVAACTVFLSAIEAAGYDNLRPPEEFEDWQSYARDRDKMIAALAGGVVTLLELVKSQAGQSEGTQS